jgi:hypothetical protein
MDFLGDPEADEMLAYIQALEKEQGGWISVEDRLPDDGQDCLAHKDGQTYPANYFQNYWESSHILFPGEIEKPTHWQPLTNAPVK